MSVDLGKMQEVIDRLKDKFPETVLEWNGMHPEHLMFALINADVKENGTKWNKCLDCGQVYVVGEKEGSNTSFCSEVCEKATIADIDQAGRYPL